MRKANGEALPTTIEATTFTDQLRRAVKTTVTDERLQAIVDKQLELAEAGDRKAAEFVIKLCGGMQNPSTLVQNNYYYSDKSERKDGLKAKTPLGNRIRQYLQKHGPTKPAQIAVDLDAETEEVTEELRARPDRFQATPAGWEAV